MACNNVEQLLITESGRIGPDIYRRTQDTSVWLKLPPQDAWLDEMGDEVSVMVYERSLPHSVNGSGVAQPLSWTDVSSNTLMDGGDSSCAPDALKLSFGQTLRQYNLQQVALESPDICLNDLRFPLKRQEQLSNIMDILTDNTAYVWQERHRDEYIRIAGHKVIAAAGLPEGTTTFPETVPTSRLTNGILRQLYMDQIREGAGRFAYQRFNGAPIFLAIMGSETDDELIMSSEAVRQDFRWSPRASELLGPLGIDRPYRNYFHAIDPYPARHDFNTLAAAGSKWVRRYPYKRSAATTKGFKWEIDPLYKAAAFEDTVIFNPAVMTTLIPKPLGSMGRMGFKAQNFRGDFQWRNIPDRVCNPDENIGFFRAIFSTASKPVHPEYGYVIRHRRCPNDLELTGCYY